MPEHIIYGGKKITLEEYLQILGPEPGKKRNTLSEKKPGDVVNLGGFEMIVLEQDDDATYLLKKDPYRTIVQFGESNNFEGSNADKVCKEFANDLAGIIGSENLFEHAVDLTDDGGIDSYGLIYREASLLTLDGYKRYHKILKEHLKGESDDWWLSTSVRESVKDVYRIDKFGTVCYGSSKFHHDIRPFCVVKSDLVLSE